MAYFTNNKRNKGSSSIRWENGNIVESLNNKLEEQYNLAAEELAAADWSYESLMESGETFKGIFVSGEHNGDYSYLDGKYKIVMTSTEMEKFGLFEHRYKKFELLGEELDLKVIGVANEANEYGKIVVNVTFAGRPAFNYKQDLNKNIVSELSRRLEKGENPIVWGVVAAVREKELLVRICDEDVLGIMKISQWQAGYTRCLEGLVKVGDGMKFAVLKSLPEKTGKDKGFLLSRRLVAEEFQLYGLQEDEKIVVTCIDVPREKSYWWGVSDRVPGLELMGDYTDNFTKEGHTMLPYIQYLCKVKRIEKVMFKGVESYHVLVRPLEVCKHCRAAHANLRKLKGIRHKVEE